MGKKQRINIIRIDKLDTSDLLERISYMEVILIYPNFGPEKTLGMEFKLLMDWCNSNQVWNVCLAEYKNYNVYFLQEGHTRRVVREIKETILGYKEGETQ